MDEGERKRLREAEELVGRIQTIRRRSDEIEISFLNGVAVDYLTDYGWTLNAAEDGEANA